ncbi:MAG: hypothetical protein CMH22_07795 [Methylophaga sp.]|nr:hypothetical protein [Methylophaga sp.]
MGFFGKGRYLKLPDKELSRKLLDYFSPTKAVTSDVDSINNTRAIVDLCVTGMFLDFSIKKSFISIQINRRRIRCHIG